MSEWLRGIVQTVQPWISTDIEKGTRWRNEIENGLETASAGIVCLTRENLDNPWIHFESGALARTKDARLCTFLLGLNPTDIKQPLASFEHTEDNKDSVKKLVLDLNKMAVDRGEQELPIKTLEKLFNLTWEELEKELKDISASEEATQPIRSDREIFMETLQIVRELREETVFVDQTELMGNWNALAGPITGKPVASTISSGTVNQGQPRFYAKAEKLLRRLGGEPADDTNA